MWVWSLILHSALWVVMGHDAMSLYPHSTSHSSADDGLVRLWKGKELIIVATLYKWLLALLSANYQDTWKCISTLRSDSSLGAVPPSSSHLPTHHHHHHSSHPMASSVGASFSKALLGSHSKDKSWLAQ